tara:strand:- start:11896 stop:14148 length:2253 start_codon:yes stop_codon:yes gene_type:complete
MVKDKVKNLRIWIISRFFGLLMLGVGCFLLTSLITYNDSDSYYGFQTTENSENFFGYLGGYISGTLLNYLDFFSYIIVVFFTIWGGRLLIGQKIQYKIIRIICLIISFALLITLSIDYNIYPNLLGNLIYENLFSQFFSSIENTYFVPIVKIISIIVIIPFLIFSLTINNKYLYYFFKLILKIFSYFLNLILKIISIGTKKTKISKNLNRSDPKITQNINTNLKSKLEPVLENKSRIRKNKYGQEELNFENTSYELPKLNLLSSPNGKETKIEESQKDLKNNAQKLEDVLSEFGIQGKISNVSPGPIVTMYELEPSAGTKSSRIINLADDIARSMSALSARISSQPGKNVIGIELPNKKRAPVYLSELLSQEEYINNNNSLILGLGKDISGEPVFTDLERMPHLLIAGTTGSGKSVGINSMIISLLYRLKPSECRLILIDPKMLELSIYEDIPHLMAPVVTDPHKAIVALKWAVKEMENRYRLMSHAGVKNIVSYNNKIKDLLLKGTKMTREVTTGIDPDTRLPIIEKQEIPNETFPYIVVVIDEMADLMMVAGKDVEHAIQRLAQMARAAGIHLIMATQRPSVDVITGTIKANFPSRISYHVASKFDSRTILNEMGAEQLLGSGDMLFMENAGKIKRLHGGFISEKEISNVVRFIKNQSKPDFSKDITSENNLSNNEFDFQSNNEVIDELYNKAVELIITNQKASTSFVQRHLQIGYNRAARIIEQMEKEGIISEANHVGKREVLKNNA